MCEDVNARIIIKQGSGVPTIPVSTDHRNGDWIATDIYEGEFYLNTDTGITYTRNNGIISLSDGRKSQIVWKALITQTGTSAPVLTIIENSLGVTITPNYIGVGGYTLTGFATLITGNYEINANYVINGTGGTGSEFLTFNASTSQITIATVENGVLTNGMILAGSSITVTIY